MQHDLTKPLTCMPLKFGINSNTVPQAKRIYVRNSPQAGTKI